MELMQPWKTEILVMNVAQWADLAALQDEIAALSIMSGQEDETQQFITQELCPHIIHLRDGCMSAAVTTYTENCWDYQMKDFRVETNAKWIKEGEGLYPHVHAGSQLSAIFYPSDAPTGLNLFDPRTNVARGYPKAIRNRHMSVHQISPKAGDIVVFPSYLQHSVSHVKEDTRLSLLCEYYFNDNY